VISLEVWEWLDYNRVHHAEDRSVGADAERECKQSSQCETPVPSKRPHPIERVLYQLFH
jgi:hypothetical protein